MKIHGICLVKNEADVIEQTLKAALVWCDLIYIFDNGSNDGTWEKILALSQNHQQIIPYKQDDCIYKNSLRGEVFHHYRKHSQPGDWWCKLDADEIYIDNPRIFLAKIPRQYQNVWNASFQYYFTDRDLERYNQDPSLYADEVPVEQKCRYYLNNWSEARFFRDDEKLVWEKERAWPYIGAVYPVRIWLKHYQYRSPQQIQKRIEVRLKARERGSRRFPHEARSNQWQEKIALASELNYDDGQGKYLLREDLMPKLPLINPTVINSLRQAKKYFNRDVMENISRTLGSKLFINRF